MALILSMKHYAESLPYSTVHGSYPTAISLREVQFYLFKTYMIKCAIVE